MVKNCSSMVREIFTGRFARRDSTETKASSLIYSLAPKPPPRNGTRTRTLFSGQPSSRAISMRTNDGLCEAVWMVSELSVDSATDTSGSSGVCITCCVLKRCSNTRWASLNAFSALPRRR
jgi:hypothetical protein